MMRRLSAYGQEPGERLTRKISWRESDIEHPTRMKKQVKYSVAILHCLADVL